MEKYYALKIYRGFELESHILFFVSWYSNTFDEVCVNISERCTVCHIFDVFVRYVVTEIKYWNLYNNTVLSFLCSTKRRVANFTLSNFAHMSFLTVPCIVS